MKNSSVKAIYALIITLMVLGLSLVTSAILIFNQYYIIIPKNGVEIIEIPPYLSECKRIGNTNLVIFRKDTLELRMLVKKSYSLGILTRNQIKMKLEEIKNTQKDN